MTLRQRTLLIVIFVLLVAVAMIYLLVNVLLLSSFASLEEQFLVRNVQRASNAIEDTIKTLDVTTEDYAGWDDTYNFAQNVDPQYIDDNYYDETFADLGIDLLIITDETGEPLFSKAYDVENETEIPVPPDLLASLTGDSVFQQFADESSYMRGILLVPGSHTPIMVSSHPILTSMSLGPIQGAFIMARSLNEIEIARLNELTNLDFTVYPVAADIELPNEAQLALTNLLNDPETAVYTLEVDRQTAVGYSLLHDVYGKPSLLVHVDQTRDIYRQGQISVRLTLAALLIVGALLCVVVVIVIDRLVLRRLAALSIAVADISESGDLSRHIVVEGRDELSYLTSDINQMLTSLDKTQRDLAQAKEKAEKANQAKSDFISMVTHEMRVPLTSIHGYAGLLANPMSDPLTEQQQSFIHPIRQNAIRMERLITDLSDLERIETNRLRLLIESIPVTPAVQEVIDLLRGEIEKKEQNLQLDIADDLPHVEADHNRLIQILLNLVSNAHKYTPVGGDIIIRVRQMADGDEPVIHIAVSDTGYGIHPDDQKNVFSQFFRASDKAVRQEIGTGLGLYITRLLVEMQNGRIWFESTYQQGTTFHFTLPIAD